MKRKKNPSGIIILAILVGALLFIIGMRCGLHDKQALAEEYANDIVATAIVPYNERIAALEQELNAEKQIEHVVVTYEYKPLPVDYENIGVTMPEDSDAVLLAKTMWGEFRDSSNYNQCAAVCWCALNRVDANFGDLRSVLTGGQFHGYAKENPVDADLYSIAVEVLTRWQLEKIAFNTDVGRVLPAGYMWMEGDGRLNTYRNAYIGGEKITP